MMNTILFSISIIRKEYERNIFRRSEPSNLAVKKYQFRSTNLRPPLKIYAKQNCNEKLERYVLEQRSISTRDRRFSSGKKMLKKLKVWVHFAKAADIGVVP